MPDDTLSALLAACEAEPSVALFAALADLCRERGDERTAEAWEYMQANEKWPVWDAQCRCWEWWNERYLKGDHPRNSYLPRRFFTTADGFEFVTTHRETFAACVHWLADRLAEAREAL